MFSYEDLDLLLFCIIDNFAEISFEKCLESTLLINYMQILFILHLNQND
jgi:hypothetical protein